RDMLEGNRFGASGSSIVVEEFMDGEEVSLFALSDGEHVLPLVGAQDHKRAFDDDKGPNTGGMGAYSPVPVFDQAMFDRAMKEIVLPTVKAMKDAGTPFKGVLFAGLMIGKNGPRLVEYNCRFGDPECQVLMMRLQDDLGELLLACAENRLAGVQPVKMSQDAALTVVMAATGYPGTPETGGAIDLGEAEANGAKVFHAGTALEGSKLVASGGRVLSVAATGATVAEAAAKAYAAVDAIAFPSGFCRRDIGWRELAREGSVSLH
ncbi:MAG: phosphoribosylamine--glycine ligase, partial [Tsuneonella sp.]